MRHDPAAPIVVLSPHLDDALLSAFAVLDGTEEVLVVNVCDGIPPAGRASGWVRICGGSDDAEQMRARRAEDAAALATIGRSAVGLGFLEADERPPASAAEVAERLDAVVPAARLLVAPVGMGSHPDHLLVRDAALALAGAIPLELYADIPYAIRIGWPPWVSGAAADPHVNPDVSWERALARVPVERERLTPIVERLGLERRARKAGALDRYTTQIGALAGGAHRRFEYEQLAFEVRWSLTPTG